MAVIYPFFDWKSHKEVLISSNSRGTSEISQNNEESIKKSES